MAPWIISAEQAKASPGEAPGETPGKVPGRTAGKALRDNVVDLARAACLGIVVLFHGIMMGLAAGPTGLLVTNAFDGQWFFPVLSLFLQVMPLFFILGGFCGYGAWQRRDAAGIGAGSFVRERLLRLAKPAVVVFGAVGAVLTLLAFAGVPGELLAQIGFRISQPMWFLAVYIGCSAMVPFMAGWHARRPWAVVSVLAVAVLGVDAVRHATGLDAIGLANLAFVWLLMQQIGFFLASGKRPERGTSWLMFFVPLAVLLIGSLGGWWPLDMLANLNPPRFALLLLGLAQLGLLELLRPFLARAAQRPTVKVASDFANAKSLTVYLWHASVMSGLLGVLLVFGVPMPEPLSPGWWATRPLWLALLISVVIPVAAALHRFEALPAAAQGSAAAPQAPVAPPSPVGRAGTFSSRNAAWASGLAEAAVVLVLAFGASPISWTIATGMLLISLLAVGVWGNGWNNRQPMLVFRSTGFRIRGLQTH